MDIIEIPTTELINDRFTSKLDILFCKRALLIGITTYSGGSVADRLHVNEEIVAIINTELERRKQPKLT